MRRTSAIFLGFLLFGLHQLPALGLGQAQSTLRVANHKSAELVLVGTVSKIYPVSAPRSLRRWAVVVNVDRVLSGEFSGTTFTFTVHSPSRSGIRISRTYTIKATRVAGGYVVNEFDVKEMPAEKKSVGMRSVSPGGSGRVVRPLVTDF